MMECSHNLTAKAASLNMRVAQLDDRNHRVLSRTQRFQLGKEAKPNLRRVRPHQRVSPDQHLVR